MSKIIYVSDDMGLDSPPMSPKNNAVDASVDASVAPALTPPPLSSVLDNQKDKDMNPSIDTTTPSSVEVVPEVATPNVKATDEAHSAVNAPSDITETLQNKEGGGDIDSSSTYSDYSDASSEGGDDASVSSLATEDLLKVDPMYFRLTKFLQTGGMNVAEILSGIHQEMKNLNENLSKLAAK